MLVARLAFSFRVSVPPTVRRTQPLLAVSVSGYVGLILDSHRLPVPVYSEIASACVGKLACTLDEELWTMSRVLVVYRLPLAFPLYYRRHARCNC